MVDNESHNEIKNVPEVSPKEQLRIAQGESLTGKTRDEILFKKGDGRNMKVINAAKTQVDGITFDSKLEAYMYGLLKQFNIPHERQKRYLLQEKFYYHGQLVKPIRIIADFYIEDINIIIDTKGWETDTSKLKMKLLKKIFYTKDPSTCPSILLPSTQKQCEGVLSAILQLREANTHR